MKSLVAIDDTADSQVKSIEQKFSVAEKDLSIAEKSLLNWEKNFSAALSRGLAAAAKVKMDPTVTTYNAAFPKAARDITMQLVHARKFEEMEHAARKFYDDLSPWANDRGQAPATLPATTTDAQVKTNLKDFIDNAKKAAWLATQKR